MDLGSWSCRDERAEQLYEFTCPICNHETLVSSQFSRHVDMAFVECYGCVATFGLTLEQIEWLPLYYEIEDGK